jgi:hypothetical protein
MIHSRTPDSKVLFRITDEGGSADVETLWATSLGNDHYKLDNSPFYAYAVSWKDVVYAPFDKDEGFPTFQKIVSKSGNRTVRVIFEPPVDDGNTSDLALQGLVALGCTYEGAANRYMSINIPPEVEFETVRSYLIKAQVQWEHADPTYSELFPNEA